MTPADSGLGPPPDDADLRDLPPADVPTATLDHRRPRLWAAAVRDEGWRGLQYLLRSDVAGRERGVAMFGSAGLHARAPAGMRTSVATLDRAAATGVLEDRGVTVRPIPRFRDVPVTPARPTEE